MTVLRSEVNHGIEVSIETYDEKLDADFLADVEEFEFPGNPIEEVLLGLYRMEDIDHITDYNVGIPEVPTFILVDSLEIEENRCPQP